MEISCNRFSLLDLWWKWKYFLTQKTCSFSLAWFESKIANESFGKLLIN